MASTALFALTALPALAQAQGAPLVIAQAGDAPAAPADSKKEPEKKPPAAKPAPPPAAKPAPPPAAKPAPPPPAAQQKPPAPAPAAQQQPPKPPAPAAQQTPASPPAAAQQKPATPPPAAAQERKPASPPAQVRERAEQRQEQRQERREERRDQRQERRDDRREQSRDNASPATAPKPADSTPAQQQSAPAKPAEAPKPPEAPKAAQPSTPAQQQQQGQQQQPQQRQQGQDRQRAPQQPPSQSDQRGGPPPQQQGQQQPQQRTAPAAPQQTQQQPQQQIAPQQPTQPRDAREFIRRDNQAPTRTIEQLRGERREVREGNRTVIREGDRTIVRQGNRTFIRHSEANRFAVGARDVRVDRRGNQTVTMIQRPNNITIINITDADGRLVRRVRRDAGGRQVVIIDNSAAARRGSFFVNLPPPRIRIPRERYIVEAWDAPRDLIYGVFMAAPVERLERRYTLDEVRYSEPLRARMPRVDLDVNFETGSWQLTPAQVDKLAVIAEGINRAIERDPREVFLIEGHTDAVGSDDDNLSLSDRRAEAVAVALTEQFQVPAENLITQGYGEQNLKEPTDGPSRVNRRVAVRRITPLIAQNDR
ncbi:MAG: OmpA family protein [Pseudolabrys sp.]